MFEDDIKSKNITIFPVVKIGDDYFSTNSITIDGNYCKPILLTAPQIKQSIDLDNKKLQISKVNLKLSNVPFNGSRFTDKIQDNSFLNTEVLLYYKTHSELKQMYAGIIRNITHDEESVNIVIEDITGKKMEKQLPLENLKSTTDIPEKYKNQPIPLAYGFCKSAHTVLTDEGGKVKVIHDNREFGGYNGEDNVLKVGLNSNIYNLTKTTQGGEVINRSGEPNPSDAYDQANTFEDFSNNKKQYEFTNDELHLIYKTSNDDGISSGLNFGTLEVKVLNPVDSVNMFVRDYTNDDLKSENLVIDNANYNNMKDDDLTTSMVLSSEDGSSLDGYTDISVADIYTELFEDIFGYSYIQNFLTGIEIRKNFAFSNYGVFMSDVIINGIRFNNFFNEGIYMDWYGGTPIILCNTYDDKNWLQSNIQGTPEVVVMDSGDAGFNIINFGENVGDFPNNSADITMNITEPENTFSTIILQKKDKNTFSIESYSFWKNPLLIADVTDVSGYLSGTFKDFSLEHYVYPQNILEKNFYVDVIGRINTFNVDYGELNNPNLSLNHVIVNPIDIIYDIARQELAIQNIDYDSYIEAKLAHQKNGVDWKFAFSINEKIDARKLIDEICKNTKSFVIFKADGSLSFSTIKSKYSFLEGEVVSDYGDAITINEIDILKCKFTKTKPEKIYKKVIVNYNKNYENDHFIDSVNLDLGADDYYNIENSNDNILEFNSDFIREEQTANWLLEYLLDYNKNQHLLVNLELDISYINLQAGQLIKFDKRFQDLNAYGIAYHIPQLVNGQQVYPLFMIKSITKKLDKVIIDAIQLHEIGTDIVDDDWDLINDETLPVITLWQGNVIPLELGLHQVPIDEGGGVAYYVIIEPPVVSATDTVNGEEVDIDVQTFFPESAVFEVLEDGRLKISQVGEYTIHYQAQDLAGNITYASQTLQVEYADDYELPEGSYIENDGLSIYGIPHQPIIPSDVHGEYPDVLYGIRQNIDILNGGQLSWMFTHYDIPIQFVIDGTNVEGIEVFGNNLTNGMAIKIKREVYGQPFSSELEAVVESFIENKIYLVPISPSEISANEFEILSVIASQVLTQDEYNAIENATDPPLTQIPDQFGLEGQIVIWHGDSSYYRVEIVPTFIDYLGDANEDTFINILDIVVMINYILGLADENDLYIPNADLDDDGFISILDIVQMVQMILGNGE